MEDKNNEIKEILSRIKQLEKKIAFFEDKQYGDEIAIKYCVDKIDYFSQMSK